MTEWWDKQIQRADHLAPKANGSKELLKFYASLLRAQRTSLSFFGAARIGFRQAISSVICLCWWMRCPDS